MSVANGQVRCPTVEHNGIKLCYFKRKYGPQERPPAHGRHLTAIVPFTTRGRFYANPSLYSHSSRDVAAAVISFITEPSGVLKETQAAAVASYNRLREAALKAPEDQEHEGQDNQNHPDHSNVPYYHKDLERPQDPDNGTHTELQDQTDHQRHAENPKSPGYPDFREYPEDPDLLLIYLRLLDKIFFFGALTTLDLCYIELVPDLCENSYGDTTYHRQNRFDEFSFPYECRIRIRNLTYDAQEILTAEQRLDSYINTLLHEAAHAMFGLYVCYDPSHPVCRSCADESEGRGGHLSVWQEVALAAEKASESLGLYGGRLDVARLRSLAVDTINYGPSLTNEDLLRCEISPEDLANEIRSLNFM